LVYIRFIYAVQGQTAAKRVGKKILNKEGTGNRERLWLNFEVHGEDNRFLFLFFLMCYEI